MLPIMTQAYKPRPPLICWDNCWSHWPSGKLSRISWIGARSRKFSSRTSHARNHTRCIVWICESFLREIRMLAVFGKVFSLDSFPLYGIWRENALWWSSLVPVRTRSSESVLGLYTVARFKINLLRTSFCGSQGSLYRMCTVYYGDWLLTVLQ